MGVACPRGTVRTMQDGMTDWSSLSEQLARASRAAWVRAILRPAGTGWQLHYAEVVVGPMPAGWARRTWTYESHIFVAARTTSLQLVRWFDTERPRRVTFGTRKFTIAPLSGINFNWSRRASSVEVSGSTLPWPTNDYNLHLSSKQFHTTHAFLVGQDGPSFTTLSGAYNAFFRDDYTVTGSSEPNANHVQLRIVDESALFRRVQVRPTSLEIGISGDAVRGTELELNSASLREVVRLEEAGKHVIPLPRGLPKDAWLWLRRDGSWLDYRSLGGWPAYRSAGVEIEIPANEETDLESLVGGGEDERLEFKEQLPVDSNDAKRTMLKTVVGFANGQGGTILFGVDDEGAVLGLTGDLEEHERRLHNMLRDRITPSPTYDLTRYRLRTKHLLALVIHAGAGRLHALAMSTNKPEYFVRRGATTFYARPEELARIVHAALPVGPGN